MIQNHMINRWCVRWPSLHWVCFCMHTIKLSYTTVIFPLRFGSEGGHTTPASDLIISFDVHGIWVWPFHNCGHLCDQQWSSLLYFGWEVCFYSICSIFTKYGKRSMRPLLHVIACISSNSPTLLLFLFALFCEVCLFLLLFNHDWFVSVES